MNLFLAVCFLSLCLGHGHHQHARSYPQVNTPAGHQDARGKSCETITKGFDSWGNQDDWVSEFPVDQQRRVLQCLDKKWKQDNGASK